MKRFASRLLLLLPILVAMVLTSWFVDPDHVRDPDSYERGIAQLLLDGKGVTNISYPDEAAIMTWYFDGRADAADVVVLGSSRTKLLRSASFPDETFFNASLSGGSLTDYLALTHLMEERGQLPRRMVIELSTHLLKAEVVSVWPRFASLEGALEENLAAGAPVPDPRVTRPSLASYSRFLGPDYFQLSFFTLLDSRLGGGPGREVRVFRAGDEPTGLTYLPDGSEIFPESRRKNLGSPEVTALAVAAGDATLAIPGKIDAHRQEILEAWLAHLRAQGVEVILYLAPYHPKTYEIMMTNQNRIVVDIQNYYVAMAHRNGYPIIGSYNPADIGITGDVFYDATHITPEALAKLFAGVK